MLCRIDRYFWEGWYSIAYCVYRWAMQTSTRSFMSPSLAEPAFTSPLSSIARSDSTGYSKRGLRSVVRRREWPLISTLGFGVQESARKTMLVFCYETNLFGGLQNLWNFTEMWSLDRGRIQDFGAPLRNGVTDWWGKQISKAATKKTASFHGGYAPLHPPPSSAPVSYKCNLRRYFALARWPYFTVVVRFTAFTFERQ